MRLPAKRRWIWLGVATVLAVGAAVLVLANDDAGDVTATSASITSTSEPATTTSSSTSTSSSTTTTVPLQRADLVLRADGIGPFTFGADPDQVIDGLTQALGPPTDDTGWVVPDEQGPIWCGYPYTPPFRTVIWAGARLGASFTSQADRVPEDDQPFFAGYGVGIQDDPDLDPWATDEGAAVGATLAEWQAIYGSRLGVSDEPNEWVGLHWFWIDEPSDPMVGPGGLRGYIGQATGSTEWLSPPPPDGIVRSVVAGLNCDSP